ncbi:hypothetical protein [Desulfohalovibrio reitneri]|uniref:hypothetical protein n=1 Tax=Desulfohalovibrio reitneri TaxID=1307759 RepID=UPI00110F169E|nr:hypothetical protein [Desulfohalovibrio reitneri]
MSSNQFHQQDFEAISAIDKVYAKRYLFYLNYAKIWRKVLFCIFPALSLVMFVLVGFLRYDGFYWLGVVFLVGFAAVASTCKEGVELAFTGKRNQIPFVYLISKIVAEKVLDKFRVKFADIDFDFLRTRLNKRASVKDEFSKKFVFHCSFFAGILSGAAVLIFDRLLTPVGDQAALISLQGILLFVVISYLYRFFSESTGEKVSNKLDILDIIESEVGNR